MLKLTYTIEYTRLPQSLSFSVLTYCLMILSQSKAKKKDLSPWSELKMSHWKIKDFPLLP